LVPAPRPSNFFFPSTTKKKKRWGEAWCLQKTFFFFFFPTDLMVSFAEKLYAVALQCIFSFLSLNEESASST